MRAINNDGQSDDYFYCSYSELIDSMEVDVLVTVIDNDYQGDTRLLLRDGSRYGILTFGWGSCSGCDALEACDSVTEATVLRDQLWSQIKWFVNPLGVAVYLRTHDWKLEYLDDEETEEFVAKSLAVLATEE